MRSDIDWAALETEPSVEKHLRLNERMRSTVRAAPETRALAKPTAPEAPEMGASSLGMSKAELKKQRRIERHEAVESSAMRQAQKDQEHLRERKKAVDAANGDGEGEAVHVPEADAAGEGTRADDVLEDKPFLSIGLIGQPKCVARASLPTRNPLYVLTSLPRPSTQRRQVLSAQCPPRQEGCPCIPHSRQDQDAPDNLLDERSAARRLPWPGLPQLHRHGEAGRQRRHTGAERVSCQTAMLLMKRNVG